MKQLVLLVLALMFSTQSLAAETFAEALTALDEANAAKDSTHAGYAKAYEVFSKLSAEGHPGAQYHLGILHFYGLGGAYFDQYKAVQLIRKGAEGDYYQAQSLMGLMVEKSDGTMVSMDPAVAVGWYEKAAAAGHCISIRRLATAYENGDLGLEKSEKIAELLRDQEKDCKKR